MRNTQWLALALTSLALASPTFQEEPAAEPARPGVGAAAPLIRLNDHDGDAAVVGGEADHWTVLAFFPKAMTPG